MTEELKPVPLGSDAGEESEPEWTEVTDRTDELIKGMRRMEERLGELEKQNAKILASLNALSMRERNMYIRQRTPIPFQPDPPPTRGLVNTLFGPLGGSAGTHFQ